jgi:hypothetical protein
MSTRPHVQWWPDPDSVRILAAYRRRRVPIREVLRQAVRTLAIADGILDPRGQVRREDGKRP